MPVHLDALQTLRLIKAFQKLRDAKTRQAVIEYVEAAVKDEEKKKG
jgi:hypothetical protein